jgi:hypothetical protein
MGLMDLNGTFMAWTFGGDMKDPFIGVFMGPYWMTCERMGVHFQKRLFRDLKGSPWDGGLHCVHPLQGFH